MDITAVVTEAEGQILVSADLILVQGESHRVAGPAERPAGRREENHAKSRSDQRSCGLVAWRGRPGLDRRSVPSGRASRRRLGLPCHRRPQSRWPSMTASPWSPGTTPGAYQATWR